MCVSERGLGAEGLAVECSYSALTVGLPLKDVLVLMTD